MMNTKNMNKMLNILEIIMVNILVFIIGCIMFLPVMIWLIGVTFLDVITTNKKIDYYEK
jgi:sugar phosphate permease